MKRLRASGYGAIAGAVIALGFMALFGSLTSLTTVKPVILDYATQRARPVFEVTAGALYLLYIILGIIGGVIVAGIAYAIGRNAEPDAPRFPLTWLVPTAALVSTIMAYAVLRAGLAAAGDITLGIVTVSVFRMAMIAVLSGAVAGGITAGVVDTLARPAILGLEGEAWPTSPAQLIGEMTRAIGLPTISLVVGAAFAVGLSQILLAMEGAGAVIVFSIVGAFVLGGAALIALRPWDSGEAQG